MSVSMGLIIKLLPRAAGVAVEVSSVVCYHSVRSGRAGIPYQDGVGCDVCATGEIVGKKTPSQEFLTPRPTPRPRLSNSFGVLSKPACLEGFEPPTC